MHSPFKDLLYTNAVPSDAERNDIRGLLEGPLKQVAELTKELSRLQAFIDAASKERNELQESIDAHLALVSPARQLPDDIVRAIFVACLPSTRNPAMSGAEAPLLLCQICRSWRSIALTTPRLWASIHIVVPTQSKLEAVTATVAAWLARAGTVPLHISMVFSQTAHAFTGYDISSLLSVLVAASLRWNDIRLALPQYGAGSALFSLSSKDVPVLQTLALAGVPSTIDTTLRAPPNPLSFLATKSLRSIVIPSWNYFLQSSVSWEYLNHLTIKNKSDATYNSILSILRKCPRLETCEIPVHGKLGDILPQEHFTLPRLSHLSIRYSHIPSDSHYFTHMTLPALRSLHCHIPTLPPDVALTSVVPSPTLLERFRVEMRNIKSSTLLAALSHMPSLRELQILGEPVDEICRTQDPEFLVHLTPSPDAPGAVLCPRLECIELMGFGKVSDETLLKFIQARTGSHFHDVSRLSRVNLLINREMQLDIRQHLQDAVARGLQMYVQYPAPSRSEYSPFEGTELPSRGWRWGVSPS
ncbi:hypothetical protein B0H17DRAFT_976702 [Mycena rosella]|uniref:F-box domain-containing protein n=1 Tax=Mycena rosella TaxID=1033263 RepID=A0AAD7GLX1_MYCRO|nr:hypothetical protein B0H17DRAFT_976702 [Mycena rosella]